ncbi:unnamed protein product [Symbiodinium natans]|uniref:C3H1-type domain-containing protein n=1 Tax=Symbiodinium natans TaxID=878477 RepID=A0A812RAK5_9DINO|nr:unnamed protein product [Symbiodinium natans]
MCVKEKKQQVLLPSEERARRTSSEPSSFCMVGETVQSPMSPPEACDSGEALGAPEEESGSAQLPSVGSAHHKLGICQPCAWFWKPQGCLNGAACLRCHLCPAGEIKRRKGELKQKKVQADAVLEGPDTTLCDGGPTVPPPSSAPCLHLTTEGLPPAPSWTASDPTSPSLPSVGSRLHGSGQCKPCAWFWKAEGCRNESACGHCHLCPMGEAKARKQAKLAIIRSKVQGQTEGIAPDKEGQSEQVLHPCLEPSEIKPIAVLTPAPTLVLNVCEVTPYLGHLPQPLQSLPLYPTQPVNMQTQPQPAQQVQQIQQVQHAQSSPSLPPWYSPNSACCSSLNHSSPPARPVLLGNPLPFQSAQSVGKVCSRCGSDGCRCFPYEAGERRYVPEVPIPGILPSVPLYHQPVHHPPTQVLPAPLPLPSVGSALHADGKCSPCAWFWKPQGCRHGASCGRCHLCPAGEIKQRKKSKATKEPAKNPVSSESSPLILD